MTKRTRRPPKPITPEELASILAYAELQGDKAASDKFNISIRSLQRHRHQLRSGARPDLAGLVAERKSVASKRCEDLLLSIYERGLNALGLRIDDTQAETRMKDRDLVGAIHILGNQMVTRDVLIADEEQPTGRDRPSAGADADSTGTQRPPPSGGASLH